MMLVVQIALATPAEQRRTAAFHDLDNPAVEVRADIAADGRPVRCALTYNRSDFSGADDVCGIIMQTRFDPARDSDGQAVAAVYTGWYQKRRMKWVRTQAPEWNQRELTITVKRLPKGIADLSTISLRVVTNASGSVESCDVADPPRLSEALASFFCRQARNVPMDPARDVAGLRVRSAQLLGVRISDDGTVKALVRRLGLSSNSEPLGR